MEPSSGYLRFNNLNIPQGANIVNAYIQFETDETGNDDPCNLTIYGQAADNASTFGAARLRHQQPVRLLTPQPGTRLSGCLSAMPPAQQTVDIAPLIQEIVNRSGYTSASSIAFLIEGTYRRVAESFDGARRRYPSCASTTSPRRPITTARTFRLSSATPVTMATTPPSMI
ncbi:MAG: hypothetical protein H6573_23060 [Lewinellaceae bacterium]|nr:hypothetical protein [Lewinellaceae bacterium]